MINIYLYSLLLNVILTIPNSLIMNHSESISTINKPLLIHHNETKNQKNNIIKETKSQKNNIIKENINILMMLPLFKEKSHLQNEYKNDARDFSIGAQAAIKFLSKTKKINLKIFDTENNKKKIRNFFNQKNHYLPNVIIGPLFRSNIEEVVKILKNNKIPIISPFSNSKRLDMYINVFQTKAKDESLFEPIIKEIKNNKSKSKKIYLIGGTKKNIYISKSLKSFFIKEKINIKEIKELTSLSNVKNIKTPVFVILLSEDPEIGKVFIKDLQKFNTNQIIPFGIGYNDAYYNNIEILKKYEFLFTVRYHINNNESINQIINKFHTQHTDIPNKYHLLGFDITLDTCERIINNKFSINNQYTSGLISKYRYHKLLNGGYINKGIWLIKFKK